MEKVGFIGACDKLDLIMYVAKTLYYLEKNVLVIDSTLQQKSKYLVPVINPTKSYITTYENIDFAVGFENMEEISKYMGLEDENLQYDYVLIDIDDEKGLKGFELDNKGNNNYFVTTYDMYSLIKGVKLLSSLQESMKLTKILCNYNITTEDEEYLDYLTLDCKVLWNEMNIYMPRIFNDYHILEENQRVYKLRLKKLSAEYQEGIYFIVQNILKEKNITRIKKSVKE